MSRLRYLLKVALVGAVIAVGLMVYRHLTQSDHVSGNAAVPTAEHDLARDSTNRNNADGNLQIRATSGEGVYAYRTLYNLVVADDQGEVVRLPWLSDPYLEWRGRDRYTWLPGTLTLIALSDYALRGHELYDTELIVVDLELRQTYRVPCPDCSYLVVNDEGQLYAQSGDWVREYSLTDDGMLEATGRVWSNVHGLAAAGQDLFLSILGQGGGEQLRLRVFGKNDQGVDSEYIVEASWADAILQPGAVPTFAVHLSRDGGLCDAEDYIIMLSADGYVFPTREALKAQVLGALEGAVDIHGLRVEEGVVDVSAEFSTCDEAAVIPPVEGGELPLGRWTSGRMGSWTPVNAKSAHMWHEDEGWGVALTRPSCRNVPDDAPYAYCLLGDLVESGAAGERVVEGNVIDFAIPSSDSSGEVDGSGADQVSYVEHLGRAGCKKCQVTGVTTFDDETSRGTLVSGIGADKQSGEELWLMAFDREGSPVWTAHGHPEISVDGFSAYASDRSGNVFVRFQIGKEVGYVVLDPSRDFADTGFADDAKSLVDAPAWSGHRIRFLRISDFNGDRDLEVRRLASKAEEGGGRRSILYLWEEDEYVPVD